MTIVSANPTRIPPLSLPVRLVLSREWRGLTQDDLAEVLDVSRATVSNYERGIGKKGISRLQVNAWAAFCDVDVEWLKTGEIPPAPTPFDGAEEVPQITNRYLAEDLLAA